MVFASGVKHGLHISAPIGARKNCFESALSSPLVSLIQIPSALPERLKPSVAIQIFPLLSNEQLSGLENHPFADKCDNAHAEKQLIRKAAGLGPTEFRSY